MVFIRPEKGALSEAGREPPQRPETGAAGRDRRGKMGMFAVLKTGGKQYKVQPGDTLRVEKLAAAAGETVQFNDILMLGGETPAIGTPLVAGAAVQAEIVDQIRGDKVIHFVRRRRKHSSKRTKGHRQQLTLLRVTDILASGADETGVRAALGAGSVPAAVAAAVAAKPAKSEPPKAPAPEKATAKTTTAGAKAASAGDDLKQLSGVGPALEKKLHEAGITSFAQIAAWSAEDIAAMDEKLSFKGRIEREGWVGQAKELAQG